MAHTAERQQNCVSGNCFPSGSQNNKIQGGVRGFSLSVRQGLSGKHNGFAEALLKANLLPRPLSGSAIRHDFLSIEPPKSRAKSANPPLCCCRRLCPFRPVASWAARGVLCLGPGPKWPLRSELAAAWLLHCQKSRLYSTVARV